MHDVYGVCLILRFSTVCDRSFLFEYLQQKHAQHNSSNSMCAPHRLLDRYIQRQRIILGSLRANCNTCGRECVL
jgi:hypothetical protein